MSEMGRFPILVLRVCILIFLTVTAAGGCRLFRRDMAALQPSGDVTVLRTLENRLNRDVWRRQRNNKSVDEPLTPSSLESRLNRSAWTFDDPLLLAALRRLLEQGRAEEYLTTLAQRNHLAGWNAALLLARRNPQAAVPLAGKLQQLVSRTREDDSTERRAPAAGRSSGTAETSRAGEAPHRRTMDKTSETAFDATTPASSGEHDPRERTLPELLTLMQHSRRDEQQPSSEGVIASSLTDTNITAMTSRWKAMFFPDEQNQRHEQADDGHERRNGSPGKAASNGREASNAQDSSPAISAAMRATAAEAWCRVLAASSPDPLDALAPAARLLQEQSLPVPVQAELFRGMARHVPPATIPRLNTALASAGGSSATPFLLRKAALEGCLLYALGFHPVSSSVWPSNIRNAMNDPRPEIRILFGRWAAVAQVPDAADILESQRRDVDESVRLASVRSLALLRTDEARRILREYAGDDSAAMRTAAAEGLAQWGAGELVRFLPDDSPAVRMAAARGAGRTPEGTSAVLLSRLLDDSHPQVQTACVAAVADWPDVLAVPLLLRAMAESPSRVALEAWRALQQRRAEGGGDAAFSQTFPALADVARRRRAVRRIAEQFDLPRALPEVPLSELTGLNAAERSRYRRELRDILQTLHKQQPHSPEFEAAAARLSRLDPEVRPILEQLLATVDARNTQYLLQRVLPRVHPVYAALRDLRHDDPLERQRAAQKLAAFGNRRSLSPFVVKHMSKRIADYPDRIVWQYALRAVMKDATPAADRLAVRASQLTPPEVRMLACAYFRRHPRPEFAGRLLELMNDTAHRTVQLAAVRAAGFCHHSKLIEGETVGTTGESLRRFGLMHWVRSSDKELAQAATVSLARLGHEVGYRELHRMSFHPDLRTRLTAYRLMGKSGKTRFVAHLIRRSSAEHSPRAAEVILKSLHRLTNPAQRPLGLSQVSGYDEQLRLWQRWLKEERFPQSRTL